MKKFYLAIFATITMSASALAGGFVTNTNQNAAFLRQPAQDASIGVGSAYYNPAGVAFLDRKFYFSINEQFAIQTREITSTYAPFAFGNASDTKLFKGKTLAPIIPSIDAAWRVTDKFFTSVHIGIVGGGGNADFDYGMGSLESQIAILPAVLNAMAGAKVAGYSADINLCGKQFVVGGQLNLGYRITKNLSVSAGLRANYFYNNYKGALKNINISGLENFPQLAPLLPKLSAMMGDKELECTQTDIAWTPVLSVDYKIGIFNFAAKYEFNTSVRLTNDTEDGKDAGMLQFQDDKKGMASDIPALLALGAQVNLLPCLRVNFGFHTFFDKDAKFYNSLTDANDRQNSIKNNSHEILAGVEFDLNKKLTLSAGGQITRFGWDDNLTFITDQSFNVDSYSLGAGIRYNFTDRISLDAAVFKTFYDRTDKNYSDYANAGAALWSRLQAAGVSLSISDEVLKFAGKDSFFRTNTVFGVGVNFAF